MALRVGPRGLVLDMLEAVDWSAVAASRLASGLLRAEVRTGIGRLRRFP